MSDTRYWFVRNRMPNGRPGRAVHPVAWQGRATIAGFVIAMIGGGAAFIVTALMTKTFFLGVSIFVVCAVVGAGTFLWAATQRCDPTLRNTEQPRATQQ
jgi:hypothetical protein